jgi:3'-5' exoribonuclease
MASTRQNEPIDQWREGDSIAAYALLTKKVQRQDRNGRDFLDLEIADATGSMAAKVWSGSVALQRAFEAHDFVAVKGTVKAFKGQLQLSVQDCRRVTDEDRGLGFDEALLIPSTSEDIEDLWHRLKGIYSDDVQRPELRQLAAQALSTWGSALREHPAAKTIHHAYRGGLLEHTVSMAELAVRMAAHYPDLDRDLLLLGVLFHDLGKIDEIGAMPVNEYTLRGQLVGHVVIGRDMLLEACSQIPDFPEDLRVELEHLVLSHQGRLEFASPVVPRTLEALVLHFIDNLDSKINQLRKARATGPGFQYVRGLDRFVYVPERDTATAEDGDEEELEVDDGQRSLAL